ncbi:MAG: Rhodanese-like domain protein [Labilithrix sp.]|nr:Rhodanese-like domain protein [Labilithrix sp.]
MSAVARLGRTSVLAGIAGLALVVLAGCEDPAKNATKAVTTEAASATPKAAAPTTGTVTYGFDQSSSKVEWTGSKVTGKHEGGFKTFSGTVSFVDNAPEKSSVTVDIDTDSLFSDSDKLVGHLKSDDFFAVAKFPKATFASTAVKAGGEKGASHTVTGNLTLHGVTKSITFPATIKTNPSGVDVDAEFAINRKDFGLVYAGKPDDLIRDDVVIKLAIRSHKRS